MPASGIRIHCAVSGSAFPAVAETRSGSADTRRHERIGTEVSFAKARGQKCTIRPRSTSAEPSVGPSGARATPARSLAAGAMDIVGLNEGAGVTTAREATALTAGAAVALVAGADDAGDGEGAETLRLDSESSWKKTMLTGT